MAFCANERRSQGGGWLYLARTSGLGRPRPEAVLSFLGQRAAWNPPQSCKLDTNIWNMQREGSQVQPSSGQACWAC